MYDLLSFLKAFKYEGKSTIIKEIFIGDKKIQQFINEFWTSKQRQSNSLHEISYRACFKAELPRFFIESLTNIGDIVYDPFSGRGTTAIESGLLGRNTIVNDINPLTKMLTYPRFFIPTEKELANRLNSIKIDETLKSDIDLSMFYDKKTLIEILSIKKYLKTKLDNNEEDYIDRWIRMIATSRLAGHSKGFFSVYTLPPNQAVTADRQIKINKDRNQIPEYRDVKKLIIKKSRSLLRDISEEERLNLTKIGENSIFLNKNAWDTKEIKNESVSITVTSPPFLDVVNYAQDNRLRCWFNGIDLDSISKKITISKTIENWCEFMQNVFNELYRITTKKGHIAFEVGEVRNGTIKLDEYIVNIGIKSGFSCQGILINDQEFTKTANIRGVNNNNKGTNTNRIVIFKKF